MTDARVITTDAGVIATGAWVASTDPEVDVPGVPLVAIERRNVRKSAGLA